MRHFFEFIIRIFIKKKPVVPVIRFEGVIATGSGIGKGRLNAENLESNIKKAFSESKPSAIAIIINSPGTSLKFNAPVDDKISISSKRISLGVETSDPVAITIFLALIISELLSDKISISFELTILPKPFL